MGRVSPSRRSCPTTCAAPTPRSSSTRPARGQGRERAADAEHGGRPVSRGGDTPPQLSRSAPGDWDRAAGVPDAVVAGDVRAGAVKAVGDLPGGYQRAEAAGVLDLLPL